MRRASEPVKAVLLAAALVGAYLLAHELVTVILTLVVTMVIVLPVSAIATRLERLGVPRFMGALIGMLLFLGSIATLLALVVPTFVDQAQTFAKQLPDIVDELRAQVSDVTGEPSRAGLDLSQDLQNLIDDPQQLLGPLAEVGLGVAGVLATLVLIVMTAFYVAVNPEPLERGFVSLFPVRHQEQARAVLDEIRQSWMGWLGGVVVDIGVTFVLLFAALRIIDLDFALVFSVVSAMLVVVPYLGSIAGGLPPVLYALTDSPGKALLVLGIYVLIQQIEGNVIVPIVMSRAVSLHPAVLLAGVVIVGQLFGFLGLLVAVPITSATVILVRELWVVPLRRGDRVREQPEADSAGLHGGRTVSTTSPV
jgi:predicted PurR-regulated permease PerM